MKNMASKMIKICLLSCTVLFALASCNKPFDLDLQLAVDSHEYHLSSKAGEARIFFYTTRSWEISLEPADCSWATLNKTSGDGKDPVEEILFTYEQNDDPDREVTLIITAGDLQEEIIMFQTGISRGWWDGSIGVEDLIVKPQN